MGLPSCAHAFVFIPAVYLLKTAGQRNHIYCCISLLSCGFTSSIYQPFRQAVPSVFAVNKHKTYERLKIIFRRQLIFVCQCAETGDVIIAQSNKNSFIAFKIIFLHFLCQTRTCPPTSIFPQNQLFYPTAYVRMSLLLSLPMYFSLNFFDTANFNL